MLKIVNFSTLELEPENLAFLPLMQFTLSSGLSPNFLFPSLYFSRKKFVTRRHLQKNIKIRQGKEKSRKPESGPEKAGSRRSTLAPRGTKDMNGEMLRGFIHSFVNYNVKRNLHGKLVEPINC